MHQPQATLDSSHAFCSKGAVHLCTASTGAIENQRKFDSFQNSIFWQKLCLCTEFPDEFN